MSIQKVKDLFAGVPDRKSVEDTVQIMNLQLERNIAVWQKKTEEYLEMQTKMEDQLVGRINQGLLQIKGVHDKDNKDVPLDSDKNKPIGQPFYQ